MRWIAALLLLAGLAQAQEKYDYLTRAVFNMTPGLTNPQRHGVAGQYITLHQQANKAVSRIRQIDAKLKKKPAAEEAKKLKAERAELRQRIPELRKRAHQKLVDGKIPPETIERMHRMPRGDLAEQRYNHSLLLEAPDLTPEQEALARHAIAAADAAQRTALMQQRRCDKALKETDRVVRQQVVSGFDRQRREIEKRFWQIAYFTLRPEQMRHIREFFSPRYRYTGDLEQKIQILPDITASQASRVRALFAELESECAADNATATQSRAKLRDKKLPQKERELIQKASSEAYGRINKLRAEFFEAVKAVLTEEQLAALRAFPPNLSAVDLRQSSQRALRGMPTRPQQRQQIAKLTREITPAVQKIQKETRARRNEMSMGEFGPESPQQMSMMMTQRNSEAELITLRRGFVRRILTEVYDPEQVADWIVGPKD